MGRGSRGRNWAGGRGRCCGCVATAAPHVSRPLSYITPSATDACAFVDRVDRLLVGLACVARPTAIHVVKIDNWFGPKWLGFSHKVSGAFGVASADLVVPPF